MTTVSNHRILIDEELKEFIGNGGIDDCPFSLVNPASVNLTIGKNAYIEKPLSPIAEGGLTVGSEMVHVDLSDCTSENPFWLKPGQFILTDVKQYLRLTPFHMAQVVLRSSAGRLGFDHAASGFVDPNYEGILTLEFKNWREYQPLKIYPGQQLVQLQVFRLAKAPAVDYAQTGRYHQASMVECNKDKRIF